MSTSTTLASPVFIVGSPRSGTSMLSSLLLHSGYNGYREGNLLGLLNSTNRTVDQHFVWFGTDNRDVLMSHVTAAELRREVAEMFRRIFEREHPVAPWFDKSGNASVIEIIPVLLELWPSARFIFARRRAIENVVSRLTKFPGHAFEYHLRDWAGNMRAWRELRQAMPDLPCTEIDQQDMVVDPVGVAARLGKLVGFSVPQQLRIVELLANERPQQTSFGTTERVLSIEDTGWSPADVARFMQHCKTEMDAYGYTLDDRYRA